MIRNRYRRMESFLLSRIDLRNEYESAVVSSELLIKLGQLEGQSVGRPAPVRFFEVWNGFFIFAGAAQRTGQACKQPVVAQSEAVAFLVEPFGFSVIPALEQQIGVLACNRGITRIL